MNNTTQCSCSANFFNSESSCFVRHRHKPLSLPSDECIFFSILSVDHFVSRARVRCHVYTNLKNVSALRTLKLRHMSSVYIHTSHLLFRSEFSYFDDDDPLIYINLFYYIFFVLHKSLVVLFWIEIWIFLFFFSTYLIKAIGSVVKCIFVTRLQWNGRYECVENIHKCWHFFPLLSRSLSSFVRAKVFAAYKCVGACVGISSGKLRFPFNAQHIHVNFPIESMLFILTISR